MQERRASRWPTSLQSSCIACGLTRPTSGSGNLRPRKRRKDRPSDLLCRGRGEGQSVTIPVRCTHQARAVSLDDLTRRTPSWSEPCGRLRTEARIRQKQNRAAYCAATIVTRRAETQAAPVAGPCLRVERDRPEGLAAHALYFISDTRV